MAQQIDARREAIDKTIPRVVKAFSVIRIWVELELPWALNALK